MGRDRGKFNKRGGRGGRGSRFQATSADEIELRNDRVAQFDAARAKRREEAADEADGADEAGGGGDEEEEVRQGLSEVKVTTTPKAEPKSSEPRPLTRKEREEKEKERKAADYRRRHELGLTEEFKRDMTKLAEVKKRREDAEARAAAENEVESALDLERKAEEKKNEEEAVRKLKKGSGRKKKGEVEIGRLEKIAIKKMKPSQLKEALKERGLEIQGNGKALTERLLAYEAAR